MNQSIDSQKKLRKLGKVLCMLGQIVATGRFVNDSLCILLGVHNIAVKRNRLHKVDFLLYYSPSMTLVQIKTNTTCLIYWKLL